MLAKDVMSDGVMSISADATLLEAIELLVNNRVSGMPVVDEEGVMVGILSEADLIGRVDLDARLAEPELTGQLSDTPVADPAYARTQFRRVVDVMTRTVVTADENASLAEVAGLMLKHGIKRVPVLRDSTIVGIVSRINLLQALVSPCDSAATARPLGNVTPPGDSHLRDTVTAALKAKNWSLVQRSDLVVNSGIVHLWGVAPSPELMQAYSAAVARVPGVVAVQSHMHVLPA